MCTKSVIPGPAPRQSKSCLCALSFILFQKRSFSEYSCPQHAAKRIPIGKPNPSLLCTENDPFRYTLRFFSERMRLLASLSTTTTCCGRTHHRRESQSPLYAYGALEKLPCFTVPDPHWYGDVAPTLRSLPQQKPTTSDPQAIPCPHRSARHLKHRRK
jgi:hypothetical protein